MRSDLSTIWFIGDRKSPLARRKGWSWERGHLAAKPLFQALKAVGIDPAKCHFGNISDRGLRLRLPVDDGGTPIIALGREADKWLTKYNFPHSYMIHPAARGRIRRRDLYLRHVYLVLSCDVGIPLKLPSGLISQGEPKP